MAKETPMEIATIRVIPDWSHVPMEIATQICDRIELYDDYKSFSMVCSSWRLATKEFRCQYINRKHTQLPLLMFVNKEHSLYRSYYYSLTKHNLLKFYNPPCLSPPDYRRYFSSRGWLIAVTRNISKSNGVDNYFNITIFNPFSSNNVIIEAPLFHIIAYQAEWNDLMSVGLFGKFAISTCPNANDVDDFVVALSFSGERRLALAYWRRGYDNAWVVPHSTTHCHLEDLCFFRGELYATRFDRMKCEVIAFGDLKDHKNSPQHRVVASLGDHYDFYQLPPNMADVYFRYYVVQSNYDESDQAHTSGLLVIERVMVFETYDNNKSCTYSFNVLKLNFDNGNVEKVNSLGNKAVFVGFNSTFSVNVDDDRGCKAGCIYYTDVLNHMRRDGDDRDIGIYSLPQRIKLPFGERLPQFSATNPSLWIELSSA